MTNLLCRELEKLLRKQRLNFHRQIKLKLILHTYQLIKLVQNIYSWVLLELSLKLSLVNWLQELSTHLKLVLMIQASPRTKLMKYYLLEVWLECQRFRIVSKNSLERHPTRESTQMKLLQLVQPFKVLYLLVMSKMYFYWMLPLYPSVLKLWVVYSQDWFIEILQFQQRSHRYSRLQQTTRQK